MWNHKKIKLPLCGLLALCLAGCQTAPIKQISNEKIGYELFDLSSKKTVAEQNSDQLFLPASISKLLTAVAALKVLGPNYRFRTALYKSGDTIALKGYGDPYLLAAHMAAFAAVLQKAGVRDWKGRFIYDASLFVSQPRIRGDGDIDGAWNAGVGPLSVEFNHVVIYSGPKGPYAIPPVSLTEKELAAFAPAKGMNNERRPMADGGKYAAEFLRYLCSVQGMQLPEPKAGIAQGKPLFVHESPPLIDLVRLMLENSNNHMAELIAVATARKLGAKVVDLDSAGNALLEWWKKQLPKVDWTGASFHNGSGLTSEDRFTPRQFTAIVEYLYPLTFNGAPFYTLLPFSGWSGGSFARRLAEPATAMHVWAKLGTMDYSKTLAGVLFAKSGKPLVFSIFITDFAERARAGENDPSALKWTPQATAIQDALVKNWIEKY